MAKKPAVSDEALPRALGVYAGMAANVLSDLPSPAAAVPAPQQSEEQLAAAVEDIQEPPSQLAAFGRGAQRGVRIL